MQIPEKLPGLKGIMAMLGVYAAVWISLEGALWSAVVMGVGVTAVSLAYIIQKYLGGRALSAGQWVGATAVTGLLLGLAGGLLALIFMAVKTGLHAHGPEFTPAQIAWIIRQTPLWTAAGLLAGAGVGLLTKRR